MLLANKTFVFLISLLLSAAVLGNSSAFELSTQDQKELSTPETSTASNIQGPVLHLYNSTKGEILVPLVYFTFNQIMDPRHPLKLLSHSTSRFCCLVGWRAGKMVENLRSQLCGATPSFLP